MNTNLESTNLANDIYPNPFNSLSEDELRFLLANNRASLTTSQVIEVESRLARFEEAREQELQVEIDSLIIEPENARVEEPAKTKVKTLNPNQKRAGYVDIIILMLTTWITCLCGMAYVYFNIMG